jgi:class 3 adenylate cyclase
VLITTLLPLYVITQAAQLREGMTTGITSPGFEATSASSPSDFPIVGTVNAGTGFVGPRLLVGDHLLEVEGRSLAGASAVEVWALVVPNVRRPEGAQVTAVRGEERVTTTLIGEPDPNWWFGIPTSLAGVLVALTLLLRAPTWPPVRYFFVSTLALCVWRSSANMLTVLGPPGPSVVFSLLLFLATFPLAVATQVAVYWDFTASARPLRKWMRALPWLFGLGLFVLTFAYQWLPAPIHTTWLAWLALAVLAIASCPVGLTRCYFRADALERRQIRWVVFGLYIYVSTLVAVIATHLDGNSPALLGLTNLANVVPFVGILIAVLGYRLFDIDRLISATTSLTVLGVILHEVILHVIPDLAETASHATGVSGEASKWTLSVAFGAVVLGAHGRLRPWLDRRLFGPRVSVEEGLAQLIVELARCRSAQELTELSGERLDALLRPESLVFYARAESAFAPVFARGRAVPPAIDSDGPLAKILESRAAPLAASAKEIDPFDRAVLATLDTEVLIPIRRGGTLVAFTCLGRKRSRDIYTPAELALFTAVASANGEVLQRLGDAEVIEQSRAMQANLRRYVPGAIAEQVESGRDLPAAAEREVTVLFIDLRGHASYAEKRKADDVFSTVNEHTERVSRIVLTRGGAVVEVNGVGMVAVFGAPETLADKERHAVEAAREIVESSSPEVRIGIGIATGLAYAGNIRAADRWIWSVIGDTPNLAARLQALTPDLDASIVTDEPTRRAAGYVCADFVRHEAVAMRSSGERADVFVLPVRLAASA